MELRDFRKQKDAEFLAKHELNDDQLERLIEEKFIRAREYHEAFLKCKTRAGMLEE